MKTTFFMHQPPHSLGEFIEVFWYAEGEPDQTRERVLPNGVIEWIFNVGVSPHKVLPHDNSDQFNIYRKSWMAGFQETYLTIQSVGETRLFGIRFKPGGAYPFLNVPLNEFTNQVVDLDIILRRKLDGVNERLYSACSVVHGFIILEKFLLQMLEESKIDPLVSYVIQSISTKAINALAEETNISHKQLIQRFRRQVGTGPKKLKQIVDFQRAIHLMVAHPQINLTSLAHELRYYDHAHFNHIFKQFSGVSPSTYISQRTFDPNHLVLDW